jgi:hypothetical protein
MWYLHHCCFLLRIALAIQGLLCFHMNSSVDFSIFIGILMGIALTVSIAFGSITIFTILILPIREHKCLSIF